VWRATRLAPRGDRGVSSIKPIHDAREINAGQEAARGLVIPGRDGAILLEPAEEVRIKCRSHTHLDKSLLGLPWYRNEAGPERLRHSMEAERSFTANSAHELRTPIAAALAQTQRLIAETSETTARTRAQQIETALRRLSRLSEKLMQLAKAEGGRLQGKETDIAAVLELVAEEMMRDPATAGRLAINIPAEPVMFDIDTDAFAILARNLIENGLKHGASDAPVVVILSTDGVLTVSNEGTAVPPEMLEHLSRPFERGNTEAEGSGLGLAIAKTIASGVGGELVLTSP
jgi:two-component system OmpR family sensor kinase